MGRIFKHAAVAVLSAFLLASTSALPLPKTQEGAERTPASRIYYLSIMPGKIMSARPDGTGIQTIVSGLTNAPDGIAIDKAAGYIYFSQMGSAMGSSNTGSIHRVNLDGSGLMTLVGGGKTHTPKQLVLVEIQGQKKLYWGDREGMRVMRANIDGSQVEVVVNTANSKCSGSAQCKHVVGVTVDTKNGYVYWTQKGASSAGEGSIHRVPINMKPGETGASRKDIETIIESLPEPIDLRWIDGIGLYWTDRGRVARGNTVNRMPIVAAAAAGPTQFPARSEVLFSGLRDGIGITADVPGKKLWVTDLGGNIMTSNLDGTGSQRIASGQGALTGIEYVE